MERCRFEGVLVDVEIKSDRLALIVLEIEKTDYKTKQKVLKPYMFKAFGQQKVEDAKYLFDNYMGCLLKVVWSLLSDEKKISQKGSEYWSEGGKMIHEMITAGAEPEQVQEKPDIHVENHHTTVDESDDLPF